MGLGEIHNVAAFPPAGAVDPGRQAIVDEINANAGLIFEFTKAFYRSPSTFRSTQVLGVQACKIPSDLWIVMELMYQFRPTTVVETGTAEGGSAYWYALLMDMLHIDQGRVITVDREHQTGRPLHPRIMYVQGDSTDPRVAAHVTAQVTQPCLVNLDSDHRAPHVRRELDLYAPLVPVGGWLIVEDTNGAPVEQDAAGALVEVDGPMVAVQGYLADHPGQFMREISCERFWVTAHPGGWLQRVGPTR